MGEVVKRKEVSPLESDGMPTKFTEALRDLCRRIVDLSSLTEEFFLSIGTKVQEYSDGASSITKMAMSASEIMSGDEIRGAIVGLEGMVDQLEGIFHRVDSVSTGNLETLRTIGWSVRSVEKELTGLGDTSRDLKMLALSTKIQSTRTGGGSSAFMQLGQDITRMSGIISSRAADLFKETATLSDFVLDVQSTLQKLKSEQKFQTDSVLKGTRSIIESLADRSAHSTKEAARIRQSSEEILRSVSDMVTSVQFQDITSQSLDRTLESLNGILEGFSDGEVGGETPPSPLPQVSREVLITARCVREAQRLEKTDALVQEAFRKMVRSLEGIKSNIGSMEAITSASNRENVTFLNDLEKAMSYVTSFLKEVVQSSREMSESMNSLARTVEGMSEFTEDIEMMSSEVELISLNARIMAAQAGVDGAGMGVIAEAVQNTASDSEDQRRSVVGKLNEISRASVDLKEKIENAAQGEEVKLDHLVRELGAFLEALRAMLQKILSMLVDIDRQSSELKKGLDASIENIRDHFTREMRSLDIAGHMKDLAWECWRSLKPEDHEMLTGGRVGEGELQGMAWEQRMGLVDGFLKEHGLDGLSDEVHDASADNGNIMFFNNGTSGRTGE